MENIIAKHLLDIKAVTLQPENPYTWASGIISPIYCDNRLTLSYPKVRKDIEEGLASLVKQYYSDAEMIMGTATAGIAHAALVADILDLPMGYVRASAKTHGKGNSIEGSIKDNLKVVVVEDLISTGKSSIEVVRTLREKNVEVLGVISIFNYNLPQAEINFKSENIKYHSLSNYNILIETALKNNYISQNNYPKLKKWHENPESKDWMK